MGSGPFAYLLYDDEITADRVDSGLEPGHGLRHGHDGRNHGRATVERRSLC